MQNPVGRPFSIHVPPRKIHHLHDISQSLQEGDVQSGKNLCSTSITLLRLPLTASVTTGRSVPLIIFKKGWTKVWDVAKLVYNTIKWYITHVSAENSSKDVDFPILWNSGEIFHFLEFFPQSIGGLLQNRSIWAKLSLPKIGHLYLLSIIPVNLIYLTYLIDLKIGSPWFSTRPGNNDLLTSSDVIRVKTKICISSERSDQDILFDT
jgi:hypothetical protein